MVNQGCLVPGTGSTDSERYCQYSYIEHFKREISLRGSTQSRSHGYDGRILRGCIDTHTRDIGLTSSDMYIDLRHVT